jgi:hypothetical protein
MQFHTGTTAPASSAAGPGVPTARDQSEEDAALPAPDQRQAERFIRTLLELWAYGYPYQHEHQRAAALGPALDSYNHSRRHRALNGLTPLQRVNNLSGTNN